MIAILYFIKIWINVYPDFNVNVNTKVGGPLFSKKVKIATFSIYRLFVANVLICVPLYLKTRPFEFGEFWIECYVEERGCLKYFHVFPC